MIWLTELRQSLRRLITSPIDEMDRGRRAMRYAVDLVRYSSHQLHKDRASQTAAALTYHTLFSLLPMLVLMLVIMRFFVGEAQRDQLKDSAVEYLVNKWLAGTPPLTLTVDPLGLGDTPMAIEQDPLAPSGEDWLDGMSANQREFEEARATFGNKIHDWLNKFEQVNFGSISVFGVLLFFFAATNLLTTVERSFNAIYGTSQSRSWIKRFPVYFTVVLLSPVLLATGQYLQVQFQELLEQSGGLARALAATMSVMFPLLATWLVLGAMYKLMPTTTVSLRAATIGSFVAAVLWFIAIELMRLYVARTATGTFYGALYGALALLPLFLLWLWVTWVIILFGLELTYTLQTLRSRQEMELQARREVRIVGDPLWLVPMMTRIARAFAAGKPIPDDDLADALQLPLRSVTQLGEHLEAAGLIHRVQSVGRTDGGFALALPPDRIHVTQLLELGRSLTMGDQTQRLGPDWAVLDQLAQAQQQAAAQMTLQQVLDSASREEQKT